MSDAPKVEAGPRRWYSGCTAGISCMAFCIIVADLDIASHGARSIAWPYNEFWWMVLVSLPASLLCGFVFSRPKM